MTEETGGVIGMLNILRSRRERENFIIAVEEIITDIENKQMRIMSGADHQRIMMKIIQILFKTRRNPILKFQVNLLKILTHSKELL